MPQCRIEQTISAIDVGLDECTRPVNGSIDMRLGGEIDDGINLVLCQQPGDKSPVADVTVYKMVIRPFGRNRIEVAGVRECIEIDDLVLACSDSSADKTATNESSAAGE